MTGFFSPAPLPKSLCLLSRIAMPTVILQVLCVLYIRGGANLDLNLSSAALLCHFIRLLFLIPTAVLNTRKVRELLLTYIAHWLSVVGA